MPMSVAGQGRGRQFSAGIAVKELASNLRSTLTQQQPLPTPTHEACRAKSYNCLGSSLKKITHRILKINFFLAALHLCCCGQAFSSCFSSWLQCTGFSLWHLLWFQSTGSGVVAQGLSCPAAHEIFSGQGANLCPLAGGFSTTGPPGSPTYRNLNRSQTPQCRAEQHEENHGQRFLQPEQKQAGETGVSSDCNLFKIHRRFFMDDKSRL